MKRKSSLTCKQLIDHLGFIRVYWNGRLVYDDMGDETPNLDAFYRDYGDRYVSSMQLFVVEDHHVVLKIEEGKNV